MTPAVKGLRVTGHTVILDVMGRTQVSMQAYNFLFEGATHFQSEYSLLVVRFISAP